MDIYILVGPPAAGKSTSTCKPSWKTIPTSIIESMIQTFQMPDAKEGFASITVM